MVLSRKCGEKLILINRDTGETIATVHISSVHGNRVTVGIEAPDDVKIIRGELKRNKPKKEGTPE